MRLAHLLAVAPLATAHAIPGRDGGSRALYFLDNNPAGSSVVALKIGMADGMLSGPMRTSTGGMGLISSNAMGPVAADSLFSQDSIIVKGSRLFTVNAGSNSLSLFRIPPEDPLRPVLVGKPAPLMGQVPNAVAYSPKLHVACVTTTGPVSGVECFDVTRDGLMRSGALRPLPIKQTLPPVGPANTVSDIVFNPSQTALFVSVKGNGMDPGYIYAYPVMDGAVSMKPVISRPMGLLISFSLTFITDSSAVVTDPAYGASYLSIAPDYSVTIAKRVTIMGQAATCWSVYSDRFNSVYVFDGGNPNITTLDPATGKTKFVIPGASTSRGNLDAIADRDYLYSLQAGSSIAVWSLMGSQGNMKMPRLIQTLDLTMLGSRAGWMGLAAYPN